jgi:hypothetical protein
VKVWTFERYFYIRVWWQWNFHESCEKTKTENDESEEEDDDSPRVASLAAVCLNLTSIFEFLFTSQHRASGKVFLAFRVPGMIQYNRYCFNHMHLNYEPERSKQLP